MTDRYSQTTTPIDLDQQLPNRSEITEQIERAALDGKFRRVLNWMLDKQWPADAGPDEKFGHRGIQFKLDEAAIELEYGRNKVREIIVILIGLGYVVAQDVPSEAKRYFPQWGKLFGCSPQPTEQPAEASDLRTPLLMASAPTQRCEVGASLTIAAEHGRGSSLSTRPGHFAGSELALRPHSEPAESQPVSEASGFSEPSGPDRRPPIQTGGLRSLVDEVAALRAELISTRAELSHLRIALMEARALPARTEASGRSEASPPIPEASDARSHSYPRAPAGARLVMPHVQESHDMHVMTGIFGKKKKRNWKWPWWPLSKLDLTSQKVQKLYEAVAVAANWGTTRQDRKDFYALCIFCAREGKVPGAYLTDCVVENARGFATEKDHEFAELAIQREERATKPDSKGAS